MVSQDLWLGHIYPVVMNSQTWNNLTQTDQNAVKRAAEKSYKQLGKIMDTSFNTMLGKMRSEGVTVRLLTAEEVSQWAKQSRYTEVQKK